MKICAMDDKLKESMRLLQLEVLNNWGKIYYRGWSVENSARCHCGDFKLQHRIGK